MTAVALTRWSPRGTRWTFWLGRSLVQSPLSPGFYLPGDEVISFMSSTSGAPRRSGLRVAFPGYSGELIGSRTSRWCGPQNAPIRSEKRCLSVGTRHQLYPTLMHRRMVARAQEHEVGHIRSPAIGPVLDVMPGGEPRSTSRKSASTVASV